MKLLPPVLDPGALRDALLAPAGEYSRVSVVEQAGSTNADVAEAAADPAQWPDLSVVIADAQVAGRGRLDRTWVVPAGASMISSVLLRPAGPPAAFSVDGYGWLSIAAGVALCEALTASPGIRAELKWPNDVLVDGRKVAGILAQLVPGRPAGPGVPAAGPAVVVGAGVNVSQERHELPVATATSLALEGAAELDRNVLLPAYLNGFARLYRRFAAAGGNALALLGGEASLHERATAAMVTLGAPVCAQLPGGTELAGTAVGLDPRGALLITDRSGTTTAVTAGDVVHLRKRAGSGSAYA